MAATGHVQTRDRGGGPVFYAALKLPDGTQRRRRLGRVWTKRCGGRKTRSRSERRTD